MFVRGCKRKFWSCHISTPLLERALKNGGGSPDDSTKVWPCIVKEVVLAGGRMRMEERVCAANPDEPGIAGQGAREGVVWEGVAPMETESQY